MLKPLVLVSGASGYIGASVVHAFLRAGYPVRGTVRKQAQIDAWRQRFPQYNSQLDFAIVEDMGKDGAYDEAIRDVEVVVHTASPFFFGPSLLAHFLGSFLTSSHLQAIPTTNGTC